MADALIIGLAYTICVVGFWRLSGWHYDFPRWGRIAFAALWPLSFLALLLGVVRNG